MTPSVVSLQFGLESWFGTNCFSPPLLSLSCCPILIQFVCDESRALLRVYICFLHTLVRPGTVPSSTAIDDPDCGVYYKVTSCAAGERLLSIPVCNRSLGTPEAAPVPELVILQAQIAGVSAHRVGSARYPDKL